MKNILVIITCWCALLAIGQSKHPYKSVELSEAINTKEYSELNPVISLDGKIMYFQRLNHPENNYGVNGSQDIWYSEQDIDGNWTKAKRLPNHINNARYNAVFAVLDNGYTLLINGIYNKNGRWIKRGLSETHKIADDWSKPRTVKVKGLERKNRGTSFDAFMSVDKKVLIMSFSKRTGSKKTDLFVSLKKEGKNKWSKPKKMKSIKHAGSIEQAPFLSVNGDTVFFATNHAFDSRITDGKADYNIYFSVRKDDKYREWTEPEYLDKNVNTGKYESDFMIDMTGEVAYFVSDYKGSSDIYKVRLFENEPYVLLSGKVMNMFKNAPLEKGIPYQIVVRRKIIESRDAYANGVKDLPMEDMVLDTIVNDVSTASFSMRLPFGEVYEIEVQSESFNTSPIIIDTYDDIEHRTLERNLYVKPLNYALINGTILNQKDSLVLDKNALEKVQIFINGLAYDSALVQQDGTYQLKLSLREKYTIQANLEGYDAIKGEVDLTGFENFTTITQPLYVNKKEEMFAFLNGEVFTKSDEKPFEKEYTLLVNGEICMNFIEKSDNKFVIQLPLNQNYEIKIEAKDHITAYDSLNLKGHKEKIELIKKFYLTEIKVGEKVKLEHIYFDNGKATLKPSSFNELNHIVTLLTENPTMKIEIGGHTDNKGSAKFNKQLSKDRAKSVADYLVSKGIDINRVSSEGYGLEKPVGDNNTEFGRQQNRRVEFIILEK